VILDGKIIACDRCKEPAISVKGEVIDLWYSGKTHAHGGNIQAVTAPDGLALWVSDVEPGSVHDITAARLHALHALYRAAATGLPKRQIGQDAMAVLQSHVWPGNVRQLRNNVERVMILAGGGPEVIITADMLPQDVGSMVPAMPTSNNGEHIMGLPLREAREVFERDYLIAQISRFSGNISRTAEFVGMERSALHRKLKALGVG